MRADVAALQHDLGTTTVYVTHDQSEAMTLGHRVAVLDGGRLQQVGAPRELYDRPANRFVAGFIGSPAMNLCEVTCTNGSVTFAGQPVELPAPLDGRSHVVVGLRPEALELGGEGIPAEVEVVEEFGADAYVFCAARLREGEGGMTRLVARTDARSAPERGERIALRVRPGEAHLFDAQSGERLVSG
jgi:multiple sugar transport system ATP-binding protein